jgi:AraC-like DNA-binding protein
MTSPPAGGPRPAVVAVLADGTACYAPVGEVVTDGTRVTCHLCGRRLKSVAAHLAAHGWTKDQYCAAFGLERGQALEGEQTRKLRAAALTARLVFDPAIRDGSAAGRRRARAGELARDAALAARGRSFPEQRRRKAVLAGRASAASPGLAAAARDRAARRLAARAAAAAAAHGYPDLGSFVLARTADGASLAAMSREAGLNKDWLARHLAAIDPAAAVAARDAGLARHDLPWRPALRRLGFADVPGYLRDRHLERHWTVSAIAREAGFSPHAVESALRRHGMAARPHAARRHAAREREAALAARLGVPDVAGYIARRRAAGWTWQAIAAESGQPATWLRRRTR